MTSPEIPNEMPTAPEIIKTREEVLAVIDSFLEGKKYSITKEESDEYGLYFLELTTEEVGGASCEYTYQRKSKRTGKELPPAIHSALFEDGMPVGDGPHQHYF